MRKQIISQPQRESRQRIPAGSTWKLWPESKSVGRRGAPDRISAVDCWRKRMARGKPRRTDGPSSLRSAQRLGASACCFERRRRRDAGVRPALVANDRKFIARCGAPQYRFSPSGATEEMEEYQVELEDVAALELTIIPNLSGGSYASLAQLRLA